MPAFRVSVTRPLDLEQFTDRVAMTCLFLFGAAGYWWSGWPEAVQAGLAAYLTWALTRELDPDHPISANLAALAGGGLALAMDTHAGVLFVMLLVVKVTVGSSGLSPALWEAAVLGLGAIVFAGTLTGWWAAMAMAAALALDTWMEPAASASHRWVALGVCLGGSVFYVVVGDVDTEWLVYPGLVIVAGSLLVFAKFDLSRRAFVRLATIALPAVLALLLAGSPEDGSLPAYLLLGGGLSLGIALGAIRADVKSPTDHADHPISWKRVNMARWLVTVFVIVAWASVENTSVTAAVEPVAPLWAVLILVGLREVMLRIGWMTGRGS
ncbi:MAG: hypothetical protein OXC98_00030 [bacterium]|nr:hypothetical protein [Acidimicrobiia bacterium]MCY4648748.1 hypothetical protein [bacterium]